MHELSRLWTSGEERVGSYQSRAREIVSDDVLSGILTDMCLEHIRAHIHHNLTCLPDFAAVRSEIETFFEVRQVCRTCGQRGHWAAECSKRGKAGQGGKGDDGKGQGKKDKVRKAKLTVAQGKAKVFSRSTAIIVGNGLTWKMIVSRWQTARARVAKATVPAAEASSQEDTSAGGFGLCSFGNQHELLEMTQVSQNDIHHGQWCGGVCSTEITWI